MYIYKEFSTELIEQVQDIFKAAGWSAYLQDEEGLVSAFENSLYLYGAFDGDKLIGFIRCIGDGVHIIFAQDIIVREEYHRQGIGEKLLKDARGHYKTVRSFMLVTDAGDPRSNGFYKSLRMRTATENGVCSYHC